MVISSVERRKGHPTLPIWAMPFQPDQPDDAAIVDYQVPSIAEPREAGPAGLTDNTGNVRFGFQLLAGSCSPALFDFEILLPIHNEAGSIEATIREIYEELSSRLKLGFILCEDGSKDNTKEILHKLAQEFPARLNLSEHRKGYSRAVREGMQMLESEYLLCIDSDGQCDPKDFWAFWEARNTHDVIVGWRVRRADTFLRRTFSKFFKLIYAGVLRPPVHDPSCPYVLMRKRVAKSLASELAVMQEGFWWEFVARAYRRGWSIGELPVNHRRRSTGETRVYQWKKMPRIFLRHVAGIFKIWMETRA